MVIESKSEKIRISAPAHPFATGIARVSGLVDWRLFFYPMLVRLVRLLGDPFL